MFYDVSNLCCDPKELRLDHVAYSKSFNVNQLYLLSGNFVSNGSNGSLSGLHFSILLGIAILDADMIHSLYRNG